MNSKRTHKLRGLGDAAALVAGSSSVTVAAKRLGVARKTIYAWIKAGKVPKPGAVLPEPAAAVVAGEQTPEAWAADVKQARPMDATAERLLDLAVAALRLAIGESVHPMVRLSAMTRFQALVKQLRLDGEPAAGEQGKKGKGDDSEPARTPPVRRTHDPRRVLMAVVK